ncbi:MAG: hypothetical protein GX851_05095 [Clostridiales bacterium]|nr:hypothetical protein [Clostridiales bacterium]
MKKFVSTILTKTLVLALTFALCAALSLSAFAVELTGPGNTAITITTQIDPTYTVSIPAGTAVTFNTASTVLGDVELTSAKLDPDKAVTVSVSKAPLVHASATTNTIVYTVMNGLTEFSSAVFDSQGDKVTLSINIPASEWEKAPAGSYAGNLTFNVTYGAIA